MVRLLGQTEYSEEDERQNHLRPQLLTDLY